MCFGLGRSRIKGDLSVLGYSKICPMCFGLGHSVIKGDPSVFRV